MSQNSNDVARKPSGSSSLSGAHSPLDSPGNVCRCIYSMRSDPFIIYLSFLRSGSIPAESCLAYGKQHFWGRCGHAWHPGKLEPRLWLAGPWSSHPHSICLFIGVRCGEVLRLLLSVKSRRAQHQRAQTPPRIKLRCHFAPIWRKDGDLVMDHGLMMMEASFRW